LPPTGHDGRVADLAVAEDRQVRRPAADVDQRDAQFLFRGHDDRLAGRDRLQHGLLDREAARSTHLATFCRNVVAPGDDVGLDFEARPAHADRRLDPFWPSME
jgi:hypothetical protein